MKRVIIILFFILIFVPNVIACDCCCCCKKCEPYEPFPFYIPEDLSKDFENWEAADNQTWGIIVELPTEELENCIIYNPDAGNVTSITITIKEDKERNKESK